MYLTQTIEYGNDDYFNVEFFATPTWKNDGIGSYEYWGMKCYDKGEDYPVMNEYPIWWMSNYTFQENWLIAIHLITNIEKIDELFCNMLRQETIPDY